MSYQIQYSFLAGNHFPNVCPFQPMFSPFMSLKHMYILQWRREDMLYMWHSKLTLITANTVLLRIYNFQIQLIFEFIYMMNISICTKRPSSLSLSHTPLYHIPYQNMIFKYKWYPEHLHTTCIQIYSVLWPQCNHQMHRGACDNNHGWSQWPQIIFTHTALNISVYGNQ